MDVYSFGMVMWELLYESVPFDGDINAAQEYVVEEDARPQIVTVGPHASKPIDGEEEDKQIELTEDLANIIRRCWQSDPAVRPTFSKVIKLLHEQLLIFQEEEEWVEREEIIPE